MFDCKIIAHRGIFDNEKIIENTIESFEKAISLNYPIELDVQLTKDDKLVVFHDETLTRLGNHEGFVQMMTYEELQKIPLLNTKSRIPLLKDVLKLNQDKVLIDIEVKYTNRIKETVACLLEELDGYHNFVVKSFDFRIIREVKKRNPNITTGLLINEEYDTFAKSCLHCSSLFLRYTKCDFVAISKKILKNSKRMKKYSKYPILVWTIKKKEEVDYSNSITYICNNLPYKK